MDEILSSIRRIISDDESAGADRPADRASSPAEPAARRDDPAGVHDVPGGPVDDVLPDPSGRYVSAPEKDDSASEDWPDGYAHAVPGTREVPDRESSAGAADIRPVLSRMDTPVAEEPESSAPESHDSPVLDPSAAAAASRAFTRLSDPVPVPDNTGSRTVDELVVALMEPLLKDWLNANLPTIVEEKVEEEVRRLSRRRG